MTRLVARSAGIVLACFILTGCSAPIKVSSATPGLSEYDVRTPSNVAESLAAVQASYLKLNPDDPTSIKLYNFHVSRLIDALRKQQLNPFSNPLLLTIHDKTITLKGNHTGPIHEKLIPTDTLSFKGDFAHHTATVQGAGAPVLSIGDLSQLGHKQFRKHLPIKNLTALVTFKENSATLNLIDPYQHKDITLRHRQYPLAANYSAAIMMGLSKGRIDKLGLSRLLRPSKYKDTAQLNFLQPYDPDRTPVLFVHGLDSTPATFAPMLFELLQDDQIRKRYQFWVFSYPSGYPYNYSASLLRKELNEVKSSYPNTKKMIIVGHSMGSMISRLMVTQAGEQLWQTAFGTSVEETKLSGKSRQLLIDCLVFDHRTEINRAIFICGPHRGSKLASQPIRKLSSKLIRLPSLMADIRDQAVSVSTLNSGRIQLSRIPNSIDTLSPNNSFILAVNDIPIVPGISYHSIIGDRGKGDSPNSSDGVVEYWSSHLDGAESEKIVPRNHSAHQHPEAIQEVKRILYKHRTN